MAVFAKVLMIVPQRLVQDSTIEVAEDTPLTTVSATFWTGTPTALKRSEKTPLFSFAISELFYGIREVMPAKKCRDAPGSTAELKIR